MQLGRLGRISTRRAIIVLKRSINAVGSDSKGGPAKIYDSYVKNSLIREDTHQRNAIQLFQSLHDDILTMKNRQEEKVIIKKEETIVEEPQEKGFFGSLFGSKPKATPKPVANVVLKKEGPKGIYLWGGTGSGKTFMMDMFYESLPFQEKKRVHFHNFMLDVHKTLHKLKAKDKKMHNDDVMGQVIDDLLQGAYVICFDEFQVTDIADAMILRSLFSSIIEKGIVFVATSNRPPRDLYKNGLQRDLFLPFLDLIQQKTHVHSIMESSTDYRLVKFENRAKNAYLHPLDADNGVKLQYLFDDYRKLSLTSMESNIQIQERLRSLEVIPTKSIDLCVYGHIVKVPKVVSGRRIAMFSFSDLCDKALGAADYIDIAEQFRVIFLTDVPRMSLKTRNELRRFIVCIDAFYEGHVQLVITAESSPTQLLDITDEERQNSPFDEIFAFDRTISRLLEMQSRSYIETHSVPEGLDFMEQNVFNAQLMLSNDEKTKALWDYYLLNKEHESQGVLKNTLSRDVMEVAVRDILVFHGLKHPRGFQKLCKHYGLHTHQDHSAHHLHLDSVSLAVNAMLSGHNDLNNYTYDNFCKTFEHVLTTL